MNYEQRPTRWSGWPRHARVEYIITNYSRREIANAVAEKAHFSAERDFGDDPRFRKREIAKIYLSLGGCNE